MRSDPAGIGALFVLVAGGIVIYGVLAQLLRATSLGEMKDMLRRPPAVPSFRRAAGPSLDLLRGQRHNPRQISHPRGSTPQGVNFHEPHFFGRAAHR